MPRSLRKQNVFNYIQVKCSAMSLIFVCKNGKKKKNVFFWGGCCWCGKSEVTLLWAVLKLMLWEERRKQGVLKEKLHADKVRTFYTEQKSMEALFTSVIYNSLSHIYHMHVSSVIVCGLAFTSPCCSISPFTSRIFALAESVKSVYRNVKCGQLSFALFV